MKYPSLKLSTYCLVGGPCGGCQARLAGLRTNRTPSTEIDIISLHHDPIYLGTFHASSCLLLLFLSFLPFPLLALHHDARHVQGQ